MARAETRPIVAGIGISQADRVVKGLPLDPAAPAALRRPRARSHVN
jgi:hypothetical protein